MALRLVPVPEHPGLTLRARLEKLARRGRTPVMPTLLAMPHAPQWLPAPTVTGTRTPSNARKSIRFVWKEGERVGLREVE